MKAATLMIQGTASSVGKSLTVAGLCRLFHRRGLRVMPFKSQNMALNAAVTFDGREIGRAQAAQAEAAGVEPQVEMNPILLKPEGDSRSQVIVMGKSMGSMSAADYHREKPRLRELVLQCLDKLRTMCDLVIIEGAGSPAEINLRDRDLVNMFIARAVSAPVLLVGDIDRGGVFASFVGTLELLEPLDRQRVRGFLINKFRGDRALLQPGIEFLSERTGLPTVGVVPYLHQLRLPDEDSASLLSRGLRAPPPPDELDVVVVRYPRISNFDDFEPLERECGVTVRYLEHPRDAAGADLLILPGTKATVQDLAFVRAWGWDRLVEERIKSGRPTLGICGGCQMLGQRIVDPGGVESTEPSVAGLDYLPVVTEFASTKTTERVQVRVDRATPFAQVGALLRGYEMHMGAVTAHDGCASWTILRDNLRETPDGFSPPGSAVFGTMVHGLFQNESLRRGLLEQLCRRKGIAPKFSAEPLLSVNRDFERVADCLASHVDIAVLEQWIGESREEHGLSGVLP